MVPSAARSDAFRGIRIIARIPALLCACLAPLEQDLIAHDAAETYRGQAWSDNCREWVYFDVVLDTDAFAARHNVPDWVTIHENTDPKSGLERGFYCDQHKDAVMGRITGAPVFPGPA